MFLAVVLVTAVLRRHLEGVALVVRHSVVYAVLVLLVATAYVVTIGVLTTVTPEVPAFGAGVVAAVLALAVHPLRHRLHRVVHRLLRGDVGDPYGAVNRLVERAHGAPGLDEVLTAVAGSVASSLRVPWVQVEADGVTVERGNRPVGGSVTATSLRAGRPPGGGSRSAAARGAASAVTSSGCWTISVGTPGSRWPRCGSPSGQPSTAGTW